MGTPGTSELERIAAGALAATASGGRRPMVRAWEDAGAVLLIARCQAARKPLGNRSLAASVARLQHDIAAAYYLRTGELLTPCGRSSDPRRGLLVLAFERVRPELLQAGSGSPSRAEVPDGG